MYLHIFWPHHNFRRHIKIENIGTPDNLHCKARGTVTSDSSVLIQPILRPDYGSLCVDTSKGCSLQTPTYLFSVRGPRGPSAWREERNIKTPGPWGKHQSASFALLGENYESVSQTNAHSNTRAHIHTGKQRKLRDSLTQKLHFKTHLAGSMLVPAAHTL